MKALKCNRMTGCINIGILTTLIKEKPDLFTKTHVDKLTRKFNKHYWDELDNMYLDYNDVWDSLFVLKEDENHFYKIKDKNTFRVNERVIELFEELNYCEDQLMDIVEIPDDVEWEAQTHYVDYSEIGFEHIVEKHSDFNTDYRTVK